MKTCKMIVAEKYNAAGKLFLHKSCGECGWRKVEEFMHKEQIYEKPTVCGAEAKAVFQTAWKPHR